MADKHRVTLIPGDGIGPEITSAARRIIDASGVGIEWDVVSAGLEAHDRYGTVLPESLFDSVRATNVALKGPIGTPIGEGFKSVSVRIRKTLELYANLRPMRSFAGVKSRYEGVDLVVVRENTEDLYSGIEHEVAPGVVESLKVITKQASKKIADFAFAYAKKRSRKKVTAIHKANIMKLSDGLFLEVVRATAKRYPEIEYEEMIVDNTCMQLVLNPERFDVLLTENLYGDIISEICAGLVGGLGFAPGANIGEHCSVFEAAHGSAPDIAGKDLANPTAITLSGCLMLKHLGEDRAANLIEGAIESVLVKGESLTRDIGGSATTSEFTEAVIEEMELTKKAPIDTSA